MTYVDRSAAIKMKENRESNNQLKYDNQLGIWKELIDAWNKILHLRSNSTPQVHFELISEFPKSPFIKVYEWTGECRGKYCIAELRNFNDIAGFLYSLKIQEIEEETKSEPDKETFANGVDQTRRNFSRHNF